MTFRLRTAVIAGSLLLTLSGCANPTFIGVQDYGSVYGNVVSTAGAALGGVLVSSTGSTTVVTSAPNGSFTLNNVAVGEQTVTAQSAGYATTMTTVVVTKDQSVNAGNIQLAATTSTPVNK